MRRCTPILILALLFAPCSAFAAAGASVDYEVGGRTYEGYYVSAGPNVPLILLIHDWDGLTAYEMQRADMLAEMGYAVFAADLFGKGVRPSEVADRRQHTGELYQDREKMRTLLKGALDAAGQLGGEVANAVAMGYCFGGAAVLEMARAGTGLKGFVTFHGGLQTPAGQDWSRARGSVLVFHGTADSSITMDHFAALAVELENAGVTHEMITYGGAPHAFTVFGSERYRQEADRRSWARFEAFLDDTLR